MKNSSITLGVSEIKHPKRWRRRGEVLLLLVGCMLTFCERGEGRDPDLVSLRVQAHFHAALLRTLQFAYHFESDTGTTTNAEFIAAGDRFRVDRVDITGAEIHGRKNPPMSFSTAYNGKRQQQLDRRQSLMRLEDGNDSARYQLGTPQTFAYGWLRMHGTPALRWDMIVGSNLWEKRFADATYVGKVNEGGRILEVVEFPQREVPPPCMFKVFFAPDLGYLPIKYVRRVEETGKISSTMEVTRFKTFDIDGHPIAVPTEVEFQETGADKVSLKQKITLRIDEGSLKVNEDVEDSLFTIDFSGVKMVHDVDEYERTIAATEGRDRRGEIGTHPGFFGRLWLVWVNVIAVVAIVVCFGIRHRRSRG